MKLSIPIESTKFLKKIGLVSDLPNIVRLYSKNVKPCKMCRKPFEHKAHNELYCIQCKGKRKTKSYRESKRRLRDLDVQKVDL